LNEAQSLLSKRALSIDPLDSAIINIRRAEIYLVQAEQYLDLRTSRPGNVLQKIDNTWNNSRHIDIEMAKGSRLACAAIDDAWNCLEEIEKLLSGRSHSSLWWGRWVALSLRAYGCSITLRERCHGYFIWQPLVFRRQIHHGEQVRRLYEMGRLMSNGDLYRIMRIVDYYHAALGIFEDAIERSNCQIALKNEWDNLKLKELNTPQLGGANSLLDNYRLFIDGKIESL
ncbi:MAG: hypothetical protein OJI67_00955, partial [Prosthecobacter sp.]|nr:hypothetical protein [Prosthecobacter sp.]